MNNARRKDIKTEIDQLSESKELLNMYLEEEVEYFDNIPENLQESEQYYKTENGIDELEEAIVDLEEFINRLETFVEEF